MITATDSAATLLTSTSIADLAVAALRAEADLTPKPGLVDQRGCGAHIDMDLAMLHASAESLRTCLHRMRHGSNAIDSWPRTAGPVGRDRPRR